MKIINLTGQKFFELTVLRLTGSSRNGSKLWECECSCGNKVHVSTRHLNRKTCRTKSCGCLNFKKGSEHKDWKGYGEISGAWWTQRVLRTDNKKRNPLLNTLTIKEAWDLFIKQNRKCALSGVDLTINLSPNLGCASLDRIDSSLGYTLENVQWVHKHINFMKQKYNNEYFIEMCKKVANNNL